MIVTVTPNPGLDLTYQLPAGDSLSDPQVEVHRARAVSLEASGKGVNVSRAMTLAGVPSTSVLFAGGRTGSQLLELLDAEAVRHVAVPQAGATRVNTTVLSPGGPTTKLNAPGAAPSAAEVDALVQAVDAELARHAVPDWLLICGSTPAGVDPAMLVGRLVEVARAHRWRVGVDSSGAGLRATDAVVSCWSVWVRPARGGPTDGGVPGRNHRHCRPGREQAAVDRLDPGQRSRRGPMTYLNQRYAEYLAAATGESPSGK